MNKSLEKAQAKVEARNFDIRKQLLKFDDVMNDQRKAIFSQRLEIMETEDLSEIAQDMRYQVIDDLIDQHMPPRSYADQWDIEGMHRAVQDKLGLDAPLAKWAQEEGVDQDVVRERLCEASDRQMTEKAEAFGPETMRSIEKQILLQTIDAKWREHLLTLEHLRSVVGFRGYAQRDPPVGIQDRGLRSFRIDAELAPAGCDAEAGPGPSAERGRAAGDDAPVPRSAARGGRGRSAGRARAAAGGGGSAADPRARRRRGGRAGSRGLGQCGPERPPALAARG